mgnify:CR=1 FL=1
MKWADLEEKKYMGIPAGSFQARYHTLFDMILYGKNEYPLKVKFHGFEYYNPYTKEHIPEKVFDFSFSHLSQTMIGGSDELDDCIYNDWRGHCEVTATYGNLIMYKNFLTCEEWFKE